MARKSRQGAQFTCITQTNNLQYAVQGDMSHKQYRTAIYTRLSIYDLGRENSDTMENQIDILKAYVAQQSDMMLVGIYVDNGWSGTNFVRPNFQKMIEDIKAGKINCVVVKDFSRFGRNYIETGNYLQNFFPLYQLRFVSVNDQYDSLSSDPESMAIAMKNIVDDYYSKDLSRKVSASLDIKRQEGIHNWGHPPYGYVRNPEDPAHWIIDTEVAPYMDMIFSLALDGMSFAGIARKLTELGAPTYQRLIYMRNKGKTRKKGSDSWAPSTVRFLLTNRVYTGDFTYSKSYTRKYDPGNHRRIPEEEWCVIPDAHPAYISHEDFEQLNAMIAFRKEQFLQSKAKRSELRNAYPDKYQRIVFCGVCQTRMHARWGFDQNVYMAYTCPGRENQSHAGHKPITMNAKLLDEIVSKQLDVQTKLAIDIEDFLQRPSIREKTNQLRRQCRTQIQHLNTKLDRIRDARSAAYEDLVDGVINTDMYQQQLQRLSAERDTVNQAILHEQQQLEYINTQFTLDNPWLRAFSQTGTIDTKDAIAIHHFIRRIEISSDKRIRIVFNYEDSLRPLLNCIETCKKL